MNESTEQNELSKTVQRKPWHRLMVYFGLTYVITWSCWIAGMMVLTNKGYPIPSNLTFFTRLEQGTLPSDQRLWSSIFSLGTYGPFIAAVLTILIFHDKKYLKSYFRRFFHFKCHYKWYLIIVAIPLAQVCVYLVFHLVNPNATGSPIQTAYPWYYFLLLFVNQTLSSGLEEPGWRGYASEEMQHVKNAEDTGFIVGIFWAVWHFPFLIVLYNQTFEGNTALIGLSLIGYIALTIPMGIITVWLYNNTRSIGLLIIFHGLLNTLPSLIIVDPTDSMSAIIIAVLSWLFASFITKRYGKERLVKDKNPPESSK